MDEETRAGFDDMRRGFAEISARFDGVDRRFDQVDRRFAEVDRRFDQVDQRFADVDGRLVEANRGTTEVSQRVDTLEERVMREIRQLGVISEDLRSQIQLVAEGVVGNERAIERLRVEMNERFRENEVIVGGAFRQIRRDLDELRDDRS